MPLRQKVKKYLQEIRRHRDSLFLAVGTTIGVVVSALTKGLQSVTKKVGNGIKTLGEKNRLHSTRPVERDRELCVSHGSQGYLLSWGTRLVVNPCRGGLLD